VLPEKKAGMLGVYAHAVFLALRSGRANQRANQNEKSKQETHAGP
jgi:hypothetical protein